MTTALLRIHPDDDMLVALRDLADGETLTHDGDTLTTVGPVAMKHKLALRDVAAGDLLKLYGVTVGRATQPIRRGEAVTTANLEHHTAEVQLGETAAYAWQAPDVSGWAGQTFDGIVRADGRIGTANHWLVFPLVFCENRNIEQLRQAVERPLGYATDELADFTLGLLGEALNAPPRTPARPFPNVDGVRFITHAGGCGGTRADARRLCALLAAYADHPNVAGVTVLSLGCQNAQIAMFKEALAAQNPAFDKPCLIYEQQRWSSEADMMKAAVQDLLKALAEADQVRRQPVPLSALKIGVKCGGSDGFSGISANPVMGLVSDLVVALGGASVLAEFPELCGVEAELIARCERPEDRRRFVDMMRAFEAQARAVGTSLAENPSPGNIRDGLITDAMKSAGAARKGGGSPIVAVLDYGEAAAKPGLSLLCTPGNDVESVSALVGSGANVVLFSTGLGTPTGNPIVPVLKIASNTPLAQRLPDMIDFDCGPVLAGEPPAQLAAQLLALVQQTAGGQYPARAERLRQYDFLFWKRDISL